MLQSCQPSSSSTLAFLSFFTCKLPSECHQSCNIAMLYSPSNKKAAGSSVTVNISGWCTVGIGESSSKLNNSRWFTLNFFLVKSSLHHVPIASSVEIPCAFLMLSSSSWLHQMPLQGFQTTIQPMAVTRFACWIHHLPHLPYLTAYIFHTSSWQQHLRKGWATFDSACVCTQGRLQAFTHIATFLKNSLKQITTQRPVNLWTEWYVTYTTWKVDGDDGVPCIGLSKPLTTKPPFGSG